MVSIVILAITAACVLFGIILGIARGFSRSLLRFFLIVLCAVGAWFVRAALTDTVMGIDVNGQTLEQMISSSLSSADLPDSISSLVDSLVRIIVGVALFIVCFVVFQVVSWMIIFPLLKLFLRRHPLKKRRFLGFIFGLLQGAFVAYVICFPLTGLVVEFDKIANLEVDGQKVIKMEYDLKISEYTASPLGKFYISAGAPLFKMMTTMTEGDKTVSLGGATNAIVAAVNISNEIKDISQLLDTTNGINSENAQSIAESFRNIDAIKNDLDDDSAQILNDVLKEASASLGGQDFILPEDFDFKSVNFTAAGDAVVEMEKYTDENITEPVSDQSIATIVSGLAENEIIIDSLGTSSLVTVKAEDKERFEQAIESSSATEEYKDKIRVLLGISASSGNNSDITEGTEEKTPGASVTAGMPAKNTVAA